MPNSTPDRLGRIRTSQRRPLACQECTKRKVKCDKQLPCSRCLRLGLQCAREIVKIKHHVVQNAAEVQFLQAMIDELVASSSSDNVQSVISQMKRRTTQLQLGDHLPDDHGASANDNSSQLNDTPHELYNPSLLTTLEHIAWGRASGHCFPHTSCSCNVDSSLQMDPPFWGTMSMADGIAEYLPSLEARRLVNFHIHHVAWHHNCLHSPTFQAECERFWQTGSCDDSPWLALYLSVLSATIFAIQSSEKAKMLVGLDLDLIPSAKQLFVGMIHVLYSCQFLQNASIYTVQAIVISTEVAHNLGQSQVNARLFSSVVGIAESLGLHRIDPSAAIEDTWETRIKLEVGKRVWCQMMIQDHFAIFFTDSYSISPGRVSTPPPLNSDDLNLFDMPRNIPTVSSYVLALLEIAKLMPRLLDGLNDGGRRKPLHLQYQHILNMDRQMRDTVKQLPAFLRRQDLENESKLPWLSIARKSLAITAAEKIIMIHRPFLFRSFCSPLYEHTRRTCTAAASTILREHEALVMDDDISIWTHTAFCITAAVILCFAINYSSDEDSVLDRHRDTLFAAIKRLEFRTSDALAQRGARLINILLDELTRHNLVDIIPRVLNLFNSLDTTNPQLHEAKTGFGFSECPDFLNVHPLGQDMVNRLDIQGPEDWTDFSNWFNSIFRNLH